MIKWLSKIFGSASTREVEANDNDNGKANQARIAVRRRAQRQVHAPGGSRRSVSSSDTTTHTTYIDTGSWGSSGDCSSGGGDGGGCGGE